MGKVYLIGAGPGDSELITLKAVNALKKCTAVMYDRLAGSQILNYINDDCEIYYCGKEPGCHYKTQDEINEMLVNLSKKGHTVGRIKGGDPYVFGRGGEEAIELLKNNIDFCTIPGITSAISVLNYAGIPVTHRGISGGFHVFTGKSKGELKIKWDVAAKCDETLIFLMGFKSLETIKNNLIKEGKDRKTPCAVIMRGTTSKQRTAVGTLENICDKVKENKISSPCIIVVGDVVELNQKLNWYEKSMLFGANICVTRAKGQNEELKSELKELGADVFEINSIKIEKDLENCFSVIRKIHEFDYIILTSVNAVNIFFDTLIQNKYDIRNIKAKFACIGKSTSSELIKRGIVPKYTPDDFISESLIQEIISDVKEDDKILIPCSKGARNIINEKLEEKGCNVTRWNIYHTESGDRFNLRDFEDVNIVIYTSPSTVKNMIKIVGCEVLKTKINIAIGPVTANELYKNEINAVCSDEHSTSGIIEMIKKMWTCSNDI